MLASRLNTLHEEQHKVAKVRSMEALEIERMRKTMVKLSHMKPR